MAYNYFPNNPYQQYPQYQPQQKHEVIKVNGRNGVDAFQMLPNSSVLLLDETAPIVWLKVTDGAGYPTATPYSITPYQPEPQVDMGSIIKRIEKLEETVNESNATGSRKSNKSAGSSAKADD